MKKTFFKVIFCCLGIATLSFLGHESGVSYPDDLVSTIQKRSLSRIKGTLIQAFFPRSDDVRPLICSLIDAEAKRIDVQAFHFTDKDIAESLLKAYYRGVEICMIVDIGALGRFNKVLRLSNEGVAVYVYPKDGVATGYSLMHNKIMLLHSLSCVITGSMNFTMAGIEKNHENLLVIQDEYIFEHYVYQFNQLLSLTTILGGIVGKFDEFC